MADIFMQAAAPLRRYAGRLSLAAVAILVVGWTIFWCIAWWRAGAELDARQRMADGRDYTMFCGERSIGGYPLKMIVTCRDATLTFAGDAGQIVVRVPRLVASTWLHAPSLVSIGLSAPMDVDIADSDIRLRADWTSLNAEIRGLPPKFDRFSLWGDDVVLSCPACFGQDVPRIAALQTTLRRGPGPGRTTYNLSASVAGLRSALLDVVTGTPGPGTVALIGSISQFHVPRSMRLAGELEQWRVEGGRLDLNLLALDKAPLHAEVSGNFGLDSAHRPEGTFAIAGRNAASLINFATGSLSPLLRLAIGAVLRGVDQATSRSDDAPLVRVTGTISDGLVSLGPVQGVARVGPLY